ncbi:LURP-one-like protein (DUF567) [Rhynchospora pubera]|uniref:LURP-one-like protein (DUF567) n=1 Tax=Rhynchospora pubera TaxID=906938 RepID=A0AAV8DLZ8_9POAL|nr:LURP-one-like protein (DUF567) [Rhynchospora pubera]
MAVPAPAPAPKITGLEQPLPVVGPQFCMSYDVELTVTEKIICKDGDSDVTDANGNVVLKLKGRLLGIHQKRWLCDASGTIIVTMQQKIRSVHSRWNMYRGDSTNQSDLICTIKTPNLIQIKPEFDVFYAGNTNEQHCDFKVKKGYNNQNMTIYLGKTDKVVAQIYVRENMKTMMLQQDSYGLTIYTNMDYAFVVAMASILDSLFTED